jgi:predicted CXXCH cytochrome family protein
METWAGATFDHALVGNGFRLQGAHASLACSQCHAADMTPLFTPASDQDCISCHQPDYQAAPNHVTRSYSQTCLQCHTQTTWQGATFAHTPSMTDCASCHHADFVAATSPVNHTTQGIIEAACSQCHSNSASSWQQTTYVHGDCYNSATNRAHQNARCEQCHASSYPAATCTACHQNRPSCRD